MADVYGERIGQGLADAEWLRDAGTQGWVVLIKDDRIRYRRVFLWANGAPDQRERGLTGHS